MELAAFLLSFKMAWMLFIHVLLGLVDLPSALHAFLTSQARRKLLHMQIYQTNLLYIKASGIPGRKTGKTIGIFRRQGKESLNLLDTFVEMSTLPPPPNAVLTAGDCWYLLLLYHDYLHWEMQMPPTSRGEDRLYKDLSVTALFLWTTWLCNMLTREVALFAQHRTQKTIKMGLLSFRQRLLLIHSHTQVFLPL